MHKSLKTIIKISVQPLHIICTVFASLSTLLFLVFGPIVYIFGPNVYIYAQGRIKKNSQHGLQTPNANSFFSLVKNPPTPDQSWAATDPGFTSYSVHRSVIGGNDPMDAYEAKCKRSRLMRSLAKESASEPDDDAWDIILAHPIQGLGR